MANRKTLGLKKLLSIILVVLMAFSVLPISVFAQDTVNYLALGDSISTGYGLSEDEKSFVAILAEENGYSVNNQAVDGNTAAGILAQLEDEDVQAAVANADLITITAGGNDLMALLYQAIANQYNATQTNEANWISASDVTTIMADSSDGRRLSILNYAMGLLNPSSNIYLIDDEAFTNAITAFVGTLNQIMTTVKNLNADAEVIVATQYNPYVEFNGASFTFIMPIPLTPIYQGMEAGVTALNNAIKDNATTGGYTVADVKAAFDAAHSEENDLYVADPATLEFDFHPNAAGHAVIAETIAAVVPSTSKLATPTNLRWNGKIAMWDTVEGATKYTVERRYDKESGGSGSSTYTFSTNYVDCSQVIEEGERWHFRVMAIDDDGNTSDWSEWCDHNADLSVLSAPILLDWQGFWPRWIYADEYDSTKHKFVVTLYKEGVTDAIGVAEGEPPLNCNELIIENGSGTYYFTVKMVALDGSAESETITSPKKEIDANEIPYLVAPTNLRWEGATAVWDAVEGANSYTLELFRCEDEENKILTSSTRETSDNLDALLDEDDFGAGVYAFKVTAYIKQNGEIIAQSATSAMSEKYIVLDAPQNVRWDGTTARWDSVERAAEYQLYLYRPNGFSTYVLTVSGTSADMMSEEYKKYFDEAGAGDYNFSVIARADWSVYQGQQGFRSDTSAPYTYEPTGTDYHYDPIVVGDKLLKHGDKYEIDSDSYAVYEGEEGKAVLRLVNFTYTANDRDDVEFLPEKGYENQSSHSSDRSALIYTHLDELEIILEGTNTLTCGVDNFSLIRSDGALTISSTKNGTLTLTSEETNVSGIFAETVTVKNCTLNVTTTSYCISSDLDYIEFIGCDATLTTSSQSTQAIPYFGTTVELSGCMAVAGPDKDNTEPFERLKDTYKYIKVSALDNVLSAPDNLKINGTLVSWDAVEGASGYEVEYYEKYVDDYDDELYLEDDAEVPNTQTSYNFGDISLHPDCQYYFRVRALGDGITVSSSEWAQSELYEPGDFFIGGIDVRDQQYLYNDGTISTTAPSDPDMGYAYYEKGETDKLTLSNFNLARFSGWIDSFVYGTRSLEVTLIGDNVFASEDAYSYYAFEIGAQMSSSQLPIEPLTANLKITGEANSTLTVHADYFLDPWFLMTVIIDEPVTVKIDGSIDADYYLEVYGKLYVDYGIFIYGPLVRGENGYISAQAPEDSDYGALEFYFYDDPETSEYDIDDYLELNGGKVIDGSGNTLVGGYYALTYEDDYVDYWYTFYDPSIDASEHSGVNASKHIVICSDSEPTTKFTVQATCDELWGSVTGMGEYEEGASVTLTATPADDTKFEYWLDTSVELGDSPTEEELRAAIVSYDAAYTFTAEKNVSLKAVFSSVQPLDIMPMLITGTDEESLFAAQWWDVDHDFGSITPGTEPITLPGEIVENIVTIDDKQYQFKGFIVFGYDETTDTETVELKEAMTIGAMPLYDSAEYWDWLTPISDGIYAAYMEYTSEDVTPSVSADKDTYLVNEEITLTIVTDTDATKIGVFNESGKGISRISTTSVVEGNKKIWTTVIKMGTKGERTVSVKALKDGEEFTDVDYFGSVDFSIVRFISPESEDVNPEIISGSISAPETAKVKTPFTITLKTTKAVTNIGIFNESGAGISSAKTYVDNGDTREWTITLSVGSTGARVFDIKIAAEDSGWLDTDGKFEIKLTK